MNPNSPKFRLRSGYTSFVTLVQGSRTKDIYPGQVIRGEEWRRYVALGILEEIVEDVVKPAFQTVQTVTVSEVISLAEVVIESEPVEEVIVVESVVEPDWAGSVPAFMFDDSDPTPDFKLAADPASEIPGVVEDVPVLVEGTKEVEIQETAPEPDPVVEVVEEQVEMPRSAFRYEPKPEKVETVSFVSVPALDDAPKKSRRGGGRRKR